MKQAEDVLLKHKDHLEDLVKERTATLEESNTALKVLLRKGDEVKQEIEDKIQFNIKELIYPYLEKINKSRLDDHQKTYLDIIGSNLNNIISPFMHGISTRYLKITPKEIQIANLIRQGKTSKEIAQLLNMSPRTIDTHRYNIRTKIGLKNKKANLRTYLLSSN
jgi:DNA-binding CsgD family transcriptional regulator